MAALSGSRAQPLIRTPRQPAVKRSGGHAPYERSISSAVNFDYARMDTELRDGDEVAFLPPVSGG